MSNIQTTTLPNGLRIVTDTLETMHSVALGLWVGVGTRHENLSQNGVAHMVEHMLFKGTPTRNAFQIVEQIEDVGGSMNAYTGREVTSYHVHLLKDDVRLGMNVLADMYVNSTLPEDEIERERQVILQEIGICNDTPDDLVFDIHSETAYPEQSLGAPILGRAANIESMQKHHLNDYIEHFYNPANTVISAAGGLEHKEFVELVSELFAGQKSSQPCNYDAANYQGGEMRLVKDLEQSHFVLGFQGLARLDKNYFAAQVLSSILGYGMSSRLFQEVREKRGLVYSIFSFHSGYQDDGQFGIYAGTGPEKLDEIIPVVCDELLKVGNDITQEELQRAKAQLKAGMLTGRESMMARADQQAKYVLFRNENFDLSSLIDAIERVDRQTIAHVADQIFSTKPTLAALGPLEKLETYERIEERLAA